MLVYTVQETGQGNCDLSFFKTQLFLECVFIFHTILQLVNLFSLFLLLIIVVFIQLTCALYAFMGKHVLVPSGFCHCIQFERTRTYLT